MNLNDENPLVSIIILNYNAGKLIEECIDSIFQTKYKNYEIIVVDNNSKDDSVDKIKNIYPRINIISLKDNLGYAGGCNMGAMKSNGKFLLFLNNDTTHDSNWLEPLVNLISSNNKIGSVQPKILNINSYCFKIYSKFQIYEE